MDAGRLGLEGMLVLPNLSPFAKIFYKWLQAAAPAKSTDQVADHTPSCMRAVALPAVE
jgi:hypothetical protein